MRLQRLRVDRAIAVGHHAGGDERLAALHLEADDGHLRHVRAGGQRGLDLDRRETVAEGLDDVIVAAVEREVAVAVDGRQIAAHEPLAAVDRRLFPRSTPVPEHEPGVRAMHRQQPHLAGRQRLLSALLRQDRHPPAGLRPPGRPRAHRRAGAGGDVRAHLGHAQRLVELRAGATTPLVEHIGGQRLAGAEAMPQRAQVRVLRPPILQQLAVDGGHGDEDRHRQPLHQRRPAARVRRPAVEHGVRARGPRIGEADAERVRPVERPGVQRHVPRAEALPPVAHQRAPRAPSDGRAAHPSDARWCRRCKSGTRELPRRCRAADRGRRAHRDRRPRSRCRGSPGGASPASSPPRARRRRPQGRPPPAASTGARRAPAPARPRSRRRRRRRTRASAAAAPARGRRAGAPGPTARGRSPARARIRRRSSTSRPRRPAGSRART